MFDGIENSQQKRVSKRSQQAFKANGMKQISVMVPLGFEDAKRRMGVSWRTLIARALNTEREFEDMKISLMEAAQGLEFMKKRVLRQSRQIQELRDKLAEVGINADLHKAVEE